MLHFLFRTLSRGHSSPNSLCLEIHPPFNRFCDLRPSVSDAQDDELVAAAAARLLPEDIGLREWMQERMSLDIEIGSAEDRRLKPEDKWRMNFTPWGWRLWQADKLPTLGIRRHKNKSVRPTSYGARADRTRTSLWCHKNTRTWRATAHAAGMPCATTDSAKV